MDPFKLVYAPTTVNPFAATEICSTIWPTSWNYSIVCLDETSPTNISYADIPPYPDAKFTDESMLSVVVYCILFCFSAGGNVLVFVTMFRNRHRKLRVNRLILHLSVADMIVTFVMMPMEIAWQVTVYWIAGDVMCRLGMFFRTFGFYLSSFILVVISLDRYFAIAQPLNLAVANTRSTVMLVVAWACAFISSLPQVSTLAFKKFKIRI